MSKKTSISSKGKKDIEFRDCLTLSNFILSQDSMLEQSNLVSIIRLYDQMNFSANQERPFFPAVHLCVEFFRTKAVSNEIIDELSLQFKLVLQNPQGECKDVCEIPLIKTGKWLFARSILDLTGHVGFANFGEYHFLLFGKTKYTDYQPLASRPVPIVEHVEPATQPS